jgi:DNA-binding NarL/FixJ family response regulator
VTEQLCVLFADDHPVYRRGLLAQFETSKAMEIVEAACAEEAVKLAKELKPVVALLDLRMPKSPGDEVTICGIETIREIRQCSPGTVVVVLTMCEDDVWLIAALRAGARGYLLKEVDDTNIVELVTASACGAAVFSRRLAERMAALLCSTAPTSSFPELTPQLIEVLVVVATGKNNDQIARALGLAPKTVSNYVSQICTKLGVRSRAELVALARDRGVTGQGQ